MRFDAKPTVADIFLMTAQMYDFFQIWRSVDNPPVLSYFQGERLAASRDGNPDIVVRNPRRLRRLE